MSGGQLNRLINVEARGASDDGYGNAVADTWSTVIANEPAEIRPLRGGEGVEAAKLQGKALVEIRVRHSARTAQITTAHRIANARVAGEFYNVRYIENPDMRGRYLKIVAERGVAHG